MTEEGAKSQQTRRRHKLRLGSRTLQLPDNRILRIAVGSTLVLGGIFGFLPVLGFWMIPLGMVVLSIDMHWARRLRRRLAVWVARRYPRIAEKLNGSSQ